MELEIDLVTPRRPQVVSIAAGLLLGTAAVLMLGWIAWPDQVVSNGGQVFFIMLWSILAYAAFAGLGWVRLAIAAILVTNVWAFLNAPSTGSAWDSMSAADVVSRTIQMAALIILCLPESNRWFEAITAVNKED